MEEAIEKSTRAMRLAAQKRAQLAEAQQDLQRVLIQGKGQAGKFSGQMVGAYSLGKLIGRAQWVRSISPTIRVQGTGGCKALDARSY